MTMGCGAWLRFDGGDGDLVAPGFESDSKAFGNWLAGVLVDARAGAALDADGMALLTIQAEWLEGAERWTTPEALVGAAETTRSLANDSIPIVRDEAERALARLR